MDLLNTKLKLKDKNLKFHGQVKFIILLLIIYQTLFNYDYES